MSKKEVRQAAAELTERLCEKDFLDRSGLSRKNVMMLMNKDLGGTVCPYFPD